MKLQTSDRISFLPFADCIDLLQKLEPDIRTLQLGSGDFREDSIWNRLKEQWEVIHKDGPAVIRDCYAFCSILLAAFHSPCDSFDLLMWLNSSKRIEVLRQLDLALIIGTETFRSDLLSFVDVFSPPCDPPSMENAQNDCSEFIGMISSCEYKSVKSTLPALSVSKVEGVDVKKFVSLQTPIIITGSMSHWPAMSSRKWSSISYLKRVMGHRTVPVEVGNHYMAENWQVQLLTVSNFLDQYLLHSPSNQVGYLAQVQLFDHVPSLFSDIVVPDYIAFSSSADPILNAWLGPSGTVSPCHFDPTDNLLCQVFGYKFIRLFSPDEACNLYPSDSSKLHNTSLVDVESPDLAQFPLFSKATYFDCILEPGEMIFIPKGWWHFVRSLTPSFSVSFWWERDLFV